MTRSPFFILRSLCMVPVLLAGVVAQAFPGYSATPPPVPYTSANQVNQLLARLEQSCKTMQGDLGELRVDKWKTDGNTKKDTQSNVESIQRNLQSALPEMVGQLRASPESLLATFKLYRNLSALYDVFNSVTESAGAFGSKDEFQSLQNDLSALDQSRRSFGDRMEDVAIAKDAEITRLRTQIQSQSTPPAPPKKVIVDDTEPPKKPPVKKKPATTPAGTKPSSPPAGATNTTTPPKAPQ